MINKKKHDVLCWRQALSYTTLPKICTFRTFNASIIVKWIYCGKKNNVARNFSNKKIEY